MDNKDLGARPADQALAVPVEPANGLDPAGFDPSRAELNAYLIDACGRGIPYFDDAQTLEQAMHGLAYIQRQILSTRNYRVLIGQGEAATSSIQWVLDYFARSALIGPALTSDMKRLIVAARRISFTDQSREMFEELDNASEAFAAAVPWDGEPASVGTHPQGGDAKQAPCASMGDAVHEVQTPANPLISQGTNP